MTDRLHLETQHRSVLEALVEKHLPGVEVWAYGSRVNGSSHNGSHLNLVLRGAGLKEIPAEQLVDFEEAVRESRLPFLVEARDWARLSEQVRGEIERGDVVFRGKCDGDQRWDSIPFTMAAKLIRDTVLPDVLNNQPYIGLEHIGAGSLCLTGVGVASDAKSVKSQFRQGDILFGKLRPYFRKVVRSRMDGVCSTDIWVVRSAPNIDQGYLYYVMASPDFIDYTIRGSEGTRMPRAKWEFVERYMMPLPPLPQQRAIAHILGTLDDKIELNRRMNETLEAMAQAIFKDWFVDFGPVRAKMEGRAPYLPKGIWDLFPDRLHDSEIGGVPMGWIVTKLSNLFEVNPRRSLKRGQTAPYVDMASMPVRGHMPHSVIDRPFGSGMRFTNGDTVIARITPCLENGKTAFIDFLPKGQIGWGSTEYIILKSIPPIPDQFAYCLARSTRFRDFAIRNMSGTSGRQRVSTQALFGFPVIEPPDHLALAFGQVSGSLLSRAGKATVESQFLAVLRDTLLPKLLSGEIRLGEAEKVVEAVT